MSPASPPQQGYTWIDQPDSLAALVADLKPQDMLAVDTESNSLFAYREQVCLIQFSTRNADYLVDPLNLADLSPLEDIFDDPKIEKIFHAAEYDLICLKRDFGFHFRHIFDTMQTGRILGFPSLGLAAMLENSFQVLLDKKYQRANWGQRPLPDEMKDYACVDSHFLIPLRDQLYKELIVQDRLQLALEDFERISLVEPQSLVPRPNAWQIAGSQKLDPQQNAVLKKLWELRENLARQKNRPVFKIMSNNDLQEIARLSPRNANDLQHIAGISPAVLQRYQDAILAAVHEGLNSKPLFRTCSPRPSPEYLCREDLLKRWRIQAAKAMKVESDVVLPRETLQEIAARNPRSLLELKEIMKKQQWRYKHFGHEILSALKSQEVA